jgi:Flp pilus assembly protein TadB
LKLIGGSYLIYQDFTNSAVTVLILFVAFIVGHQMDFLADRWRTPTKTKTSSTMAIEELKGLYPHLKIDFRPRDRAIFFTIIRRRHGEIAGTIDNNKAISVLFQNVSLGLFLYATVLGIKLFTEGFAAVNLLLLIVVIVLSILARQRSKLFNLWFNNLIFETALTYGTSTNEIIRQTQSLGNNGIAQSDSTKKRGRRDE